MVPTPEAHIHTYTRRCVFIHLHMYLSLRRLFIGTLMLEFSSYSLRGCFADSGFSQGSGPDGSDRVQIRTP